MLKSRKSLQKTIEGQALTINEYAKRLTEKDDIKVTIVTIDDNNNNLLCIINRNSCNK